MKLMMRIDDVGYSRAHNLGSFKAIDEGIATSADTMLDCPGTVEALEFLRERPWITVGWHTHFWGSPLLPPEKIPSLVEEENGCIYFRKDIQRSEEIEYKEIYAEAKAQIERCIRILGRAPDAGSGRNGGSPFSQALYDVSREFGMPVSYIKMGKFDPPSKFAQLMMREEPEVGPIYSANGESALKMLPYETKETVTLRQNVSYSPLRYFLEDPCRMLDYGDDECVMAVLHPGAVDDFVMSRGSNIHYYLVRPLDVKCLVSPQLHDWVKEHNVVLSNLNDCLYGTHAYQTHLKFIGSDLYKG